MIVKTGIIRNIDKLGRISIPKDLRLAMHVENDDAMEVWYGDNMVAFKKLTTENFMKEILSLVKIELDKIDDGSDKDAIISKIDDIENILNYGFVI